MQRSTHRYAFPEQRAELRMNKPSWLRLAKDGSVFRRFLCLLLTCFCIISASAASSISEGVGLYIGSFDPPTQAHREIVLTAALKANLRNVYISVNRGGKHSSKDYRWSLGERITMVRSMLRGSSIRVVVLEEPIEGRVALAHQISALHQKPLRGIFGADTLEKDYEIFKVVPGFEYIAVNRPGYALPTLPERVVVYSLDSPGNISSTEVRKKLSEGVRNIPELHPTVESFIYANNPLDATPKDEEANYRLIYADFQKKILRQLPELGIESLAIPPFNPHQTVQGQKEKIIRAALTLSDDSNRRQVLTNGQHTIETYHRTYPIEDQRKAGFFLGSFDPISKGQITSINKAIDALDLDVIYFSPLETSRKPIVYPILDRMAALELVKDRVNADVRLLPSRNLLESVEVVDRVKDRHPNGVVAVFGETVFDANYKRMVKINGLEFAVFTFGEDAFLDLPDGVTQISADPSIKGVYDDVHQLFIDRGDEPLSAVAQ